MKTILALVVIVIICGYVGYSALDYLSFFDYKTKKPRYGEINLVAVDEYDLGILLPLKTEIKPGTGKILVNIDYPVFITDTQQSIQQAVRTAEQITHQDLSGYDIIYSVETDAEIVGGPSAGAALTIVTIGTLYNKDVREDVVITGAIGENGKILPVGGILEKAQAAEDAGIQKFLVPEGESIIINTFERCSGYGVHRSCTYIDQRLDIRDIVNIEVIEVGTIQEAMRYMFD